MPNWAARPTQPRPPRSVTLLSEHDFSASCCSGVTCARSRIRAESPAGAAKIVAKGGCIMISTNRAVRHALAAATALTAFAAPASAQQIERIVRSG